MASRRKIYAFLFFEKRVVCHSYDVPPPFTLHTAIPVGKAHTKSGIFDFWDTCSPPFAPFRKGVLLRIGIPILIQSNFTTFCAEKQSFQRKSRCSICNFFMIWKSTHFRIFGRIWLTQILELFRFIVKRADRHGTGFCGLLHGQLFHAPVTVDRIEVLRQGQWRSAELYALCRSNSFYLPLTRIYP